MDTLTDIVQDNNSDDKTDVKNCALKINEDESSKVANSNQIFDNNNTNAGIETSNTTSLSDTSKLNQDLQIDNDEPATNGNENFDIKKEIKESSDVKDGEQNQTEEEELEEGEVKDDDDDQEDSADNDFNNATDKDTTRTDEDGLRNNSMHLHPDNQLQYHNQRLHQQMQNDGRHQAPYYSKRSPASESLNPMHHQTNRYPPNYSPMNPQMHNMYGRGPPMGPGPVPVPGPGPMAPAAKLNAPCRFYSKTRNKCTWGELCRFEHREDADGYDTSPNPTRGPMHSFVGPERPYPPYANRPQPYPVPYAPYPYDAVPPSAGSSGGSGSSAVGPINPAGPPSSSGILYERKQQLAYESAPWNDRSGYPPTRYEPSGPPSRFMYRSQREQLRREPIRYNMLPDYPHPSSFRGSPMGPHDQYSRVAPPDSRKMRPSKRRHDEDESSWSDSGSEDSFFTTKTAQAAGETDERRTAASLCEPEIDDKPETIEALKKLKEIEDLIKKKKDEQNS